MEYRVFIKDELEKRIFRNSNYSMRAFARDLEIPVSKLSEMLNGKQRLSRSYAKKIAEKLKLSAAQEKVFLASVELDLSRTPTAQRRALTALHAAQFESMVADLKPEQVASLETPHHFAVKCFLEIERSTSQAKNIAQRLGLSPAQITRIFCDLEKTQQIVKVNNIWELLSPNTRFMTNKDNRQFQKSKLLMYRKACYNLILDEIEFGKTSPTERLLTDIILTVPSTEFSKLKEMLNQMKSDLMNYCDKHPQTNDVYCFSLSFLPFPTKRSK